MPTVKEVFGISTARYQKNDWGLEIEIEGDNLVHPGSDVWRLDRDGSLVGNSLEYILAKPLPMKDVHLHLDDLTNTMKLNNSTIKDSVRAGVHVHKNVQNWSMKKLFTFIVLYFTLENLLVKWCGPTREGNLFCLRLQDAEDILFRLYEAAYNRNAKILRTEDIRYCSCNLLALSNYGSVEFRSMRTPTDLKLIHPWLDILEELVNSVDKFSDPKDVLYKLSYGGEEEYLQSIFPTTYKQLMFDGFAKTIRHSARRIQMLAFHIDWDNISKANNNPFIQSEIW